MSINSCGRGIITLIIQIGKLKCKEIDCLQLTQLQSIRVVICTQTPMTPSVCSFPCLLVFHWISNSMKGSHIPT